MSAPIGMTPAELQELNEARLRQCLPPYPNPNIVPADQVRRVNARRARAGLPLLPDGFAGRPVLVLKAAHIVVEEDASASSVGAR